MQTSRRSSIRCRWPISLLAACVGLLGLPRASVCLAASGVPAQPDEIVAKQLDNGLQVVVKSDRAMPVVAAQLWVHCGSRVESPDNNGVAHLIEHLVFRGADGQPARRIETYGGLFNGETTKDSTRFDVVVAGEFFEPGMRELARAVLHPALDEDSLQKERGVVIDELRRQRSSPFRQIEELGALTAYRTHPYRLPVGGTETSIGKLTLRDVRDYYARRYVGRNMSLVVVGDVAAATVTKLAGELWEAVPAGDSSQQHQKTAAKPATPRRLFRRAPFRQSIMRLAFSAPGIATPDDVYAMDVLLTAMGEGPTARLRRALQGKRPLVSTFEANFLTQFDQGLFTVTAILPDIALEPVERVILQQVEALRDRLMPDDELQRAQTLLRSQYIFSNETAVSQAMSMGFYESIDDYMFALTYLDRIDQVTAEDVRRVARRWLDPKRYTLVGLRARAQKRQEGVTAAWLPPWMKAPYHPQTALAPRSRGGALR